MPTDQELINSIRRMSPSALSIFKRQLASLPEAERQKAFSKLSGMPELSDLVGQAPTLESAPVQQPPQQARQPQQEQASLWQKALNTFGAPFSFVQKKVINPALAVATSPLTPTTPETAGLPWWQREQKEYELWNAPSVKLGFNYPSWLGGGQASIGVKGALEQAPWFALPGVGATAGKIGGLAKATRVVTKTGEVITKPPVLTGAAGTVAKVAEQVVRRSPWGLAESAMNLPIKGVQSLAGKAGKGKIVPEKTLVSNNAATALKAIRNGTTLDEIVKQGILDVPTAEKLGEAYRIISRNRHILGISDEISFDKAVVQEFKNITGKPPESLQLPRELAGAKPKYTAGRAGSYEPQFESDIDKALYIVAQTTKSARDADYMVWLKTQLPSMSDSDIRAMGVKVQQNLRGLVKGQPEGPITIPDMGFKPPEVVTPEVGVGGEQIAKEVGQVQFDGFQEGIGNQFTDKVTGSTTYGNTVEELQRNVTKIREEFAVNPPKPPVPPTPPTAFANFSEDDSNAIKKVVGFLLGKKIDKLEEAAQIGMKQNRAEFFSKLNEKLSGMDLEKATEGEIAQVIQQTSRKLKPEITRSGFPVSSRELMIKAAIQKGLEKNFPQGDILAVRDVIKKFFDGGGLTKRGKERIRQFFGEETANVLDNPKLTEAAQKIVRQQEYLPDAEYQAIQARLSALPKFPAEEKFPNQGMLMPSETIPSLKGDDLLKLPSNEAAKQLSMMPESQMKQTVGLLKKLARTIPAAANILRASLSSGDVSFLFRQGGIFAARHPIAGMQGLRVGIRSWLHSGVTEDIEHLIYTDPKMLGFFRVKNPKDELWIAPSIEKNAPLNLREEAFAVDSWVTKIPVVGEVIKRSGRSFNAMANYARWHMATDFEDGVFSRMKSIGEAVTELDYAQANQLINKSTGRGSLGSLNRYSGLMGTVLFSPRLFFSRFQWPMMVTSKSRAVRVEAWRQIGAFAGAVGGIMATFKLSGQGDINLDPRSSDFGKIKIGDTRLDFWTGYAQYLRFMAQLGSAQRTTEGGYVVPVNRADIASRFAESKFSPAAGLVTDLFKGQTFTGEDFPPKGGRDVIRELYQRGFPLSVQDMIDGFNQNGPAGAFVASGSVYGVGITTYLDETKKAQNAAAQKTYGMTWDEVGLKYGRAAQLKLEQTAPTIAKAEQERDAKFSQAAPNILTQFRNEGDSIEKTYRDTVTRAAAEFRQTGDGANFKDKVNAASDYRRTAYAAREKRKEYQGLVAYYHQPLSSEQIAKMNPSDVLRKEYYQAMYSPDMYDQFGNYLFDQADQVEQQFVQKYGQQALDYINDYQGSTWLDAPPEVKALNQARDVLRPYWKIADAVWAQYPKDIKDVADRIALLESTNPNQAKQLMRTHPQILWARKMIANQQKWARQSNPAIDMAIRTYYAR